MGQSKMERVLEIYASLCEGKIIRKSEKAKYFGVDERSIQRDIDDLRAFLDNLVTEHSENARSIVYDRAEKGFRMTGNEDAIMSNSEILAVSKILLESRAFTKNEIDSILNKLLSACSSAESKKLVTQAVQNEKFHYVELHHKSHINDILWRINQEIQHCNLLEVTYDKRVSTKETVTRIVEPVAILFSEYYFYLNAFIVEKDEVGNYDRKYDYPAVFRIDRILEFKAIGEKFQTTYASRFEEGEYRKRVQFMYPGTLQKCVFRYTGANKEAVLDRLPTAKIKQEGENGCIFEAETFGKGIIMWLLSQGRNVEVLSPENLRHELQEEIEAIMEKYGKKA